MLEAFQKLADSITNSKVKNQFPSQLSCNSMIPVKHNNTTEVKTINWKLRDNLNI